MPAISSDMVARLSPVARSAARPAAATSSTRRASNMSSRVNPCRAAIRLSGPVESLRRARGDEAARAVPRLDDPDGGQRAEAGADGRAAHLDLARELALRRAAGLRA